MIPVSDAAHDSLQTHAVYFDGGLWSHPSHAVQRELSIAALNACAEIMRARGLAFFGWTMQDLRFGVDVLLQRVHIDGEVLLRRMRSPLIHTLRSVLPRTWSITHAIRTPEVAASWHYLRAPVTRLWRECPDYVERLSLSTELRPENGPVQLLASTRLASLVQALDGTTGWTLEPVSRSTCPRPRRLDRKGTRGRTADVARSYLGVPYKLGGATRDGADCSGLIQTIYREVLGTIIPKHCRDQFLLRPDLQSNACQLPLVFFPQGDTMPSHVGILLRHGRYESSVVHASSVRGKVVEESLHELVARG